MVIKIQSDNEHLLSLLNKNPQSDHGLYMRELRGGVVVGKVIDANNYEVTYYNDGKGFTQGEDVSLDCGNICSPDAVLASVRELFSHLVVEYPKYQNKLLGWLKSTQGQLDTRQCRVTVPLFEINSSWIRDGVWMPSKYFEGIELNEIGHNLYELNIECESVYRAINLLSLLMFFTAVTNNQLYVDKDMVKKYSRILTNIKTPYFIYYLFIKRVMGLGSFRDLKEKLEEKYYEHWGEKVTFTENNTQMDRLRAVEGNLSFEYPILDFGCNEFFYYKLMSKRHDFTYYGYDIDESLQGLYDKWNEGRFKGKDWHFSTELPDIDGKIDIICSEVVEHVEDVNEIKGLLQKYDVNRLIITTPNVEFNKYYNLDGFRRDDHLREFDRNSFNNFLASLLLSSEKDYRVTKLDIGDNVNGITPTQGVVIQFN